MKTRPIDFTSNCTFDHESGEITYGHMLIRSKKRRKARKVSAEAHSTFGAL